MQLRVTGQRDVERLAAEMKAIGSRKLTRQVNLALAAETRPVVDIARQAGLRELPKRGGLNEWYADAAWRTTLRAGKNPALTLRGSKKGHDLKVIDAGYVRHPVFGHERAKWAITYVKRGVFTNAMQKVAGPRVFRRLVLAADKVVADFQRTGA